MDEYWNDDARFTLVRDAHKEQVDKCGFDYFEVHLLPVARSVPSHLYYAALAHDILEDTSITVGHLADAGFSAYEIELIQLLTKPSGNENAYDQYLDRIAMNPDGRIVKVMDIASNLSHMHSIEDQEMSRRLIAKYLDALSHLMKQS